MAVVPVVSEEQGQTGDAGAAALGGGPGPVCSGTLKGGDSGIDTVRVAVPWDAGGLCGGALVDGHHGHGDGNGGEKVGGEGAGEQGTGGRPRPGGLGNLMKIGVRLRFELNGAGTKLYSFDLRKAAS